MTIRQEDIDVNSDIHTRNCEYQAMSQNKFLLEAAHSPLCASIQSGAAGVGVTYKICDENLITKCHIKSLIISQTPSRKSSVHAVMAVMPTWNIVETVLCLMSKLLVWNAIFFAEFIGTFL